MVNEQGLKKGMIVLGVIALLAIAFYALLQVGGLTIGSISNVATSGDVPVSDAMNTSLAGLETDYISDVDSLTNNTGLIISLVAVVVIIIVFGFKFNFGMGRGKKGVE